MSLPTLPAILSALFLTGTAGAAVTTAKLEAPTSVRTERIAKPEAKRSKAKDLCERIECTASQKSEIVKLRESYRAAHAKDREAMKSLRAALAAEFRKEKPDAATVASLYAKVDALRASQAEDRREMLAQMHDLLDARQREMIAERIAKRGAEHAMHGKGNGRKGKDRKAKDRKGEDRKGKAGKPERDVDAKGKAKTKGQLGKAPERERPAHGKAKTKTQAERRALAKRNAPHAG